MAGATVRLFREVGELSIARLCVPGSAVDMVAESQAWSPWPCVRVTSSESVRCPTPLRTRRALRTPRAEPDAAARALLQVLVRNMNGFTSFGDPRPLATLEDIHRTENLIGRKLPSTLVDCLMRVRNGGEVLPNQLDEEGHVGVTNFLGVTPNDVDSIGERLLRMRSRLPEWFIPVADCEGGNLLGADATGRIFFWDHDLGADPRVLPIADSLADMDTLVRPPLEPEGVLGVVEWVAPDFEETLRRLRAEG